MKQVVDFSADIYSTLPIAIFFYLLNESIHLKNYGENLLLAIYLLISCGVANLIKEIPYPESFKKYMDRPKNSSNTDILSRNGVKHEGTPGFPSAHVTMFTVFGLVMIARKYTSLGNPNVLKFVSNNIIFVGFYISSIVLMGWARYHKKAHNAIQITAGAVLGTIFGMIYYLLIQ